MIKKKIKTNKKKREKKNEKKKDRKRKVGLQNNIQRLMRFDFYCANTNENITIRIVYRIYCGTYNTPSKQMYN